MDAVRGMHGPGPFYKDVLYLQGKHRSEDIWNGQDPGPLTCQNSLLYAMRQWVPHPRIIPYLQKAGFFHVHRLGVGFQMDWALVTALVERWRQETHTFHLTVGETTITLQDVAILMGLRVDGPAVTGSTVHDWATLCEQYLGVRPLDEHLKGSSLQFTWVQQHFTTLPDDATEDVVQMHARAYILCLISGPLLPDRLASSVQLVYLPLLRDLDHCGRLSWGGAVLACLYRALCHASHRRATKITGPLLLLHLWSWERLYVGRPIKIERLPMDREVDPWGCRWKGKLSHHQNPGPCSLRFYRDKLDNLTNYQVIWQPYTLDIIFFKLPDICVEGQGVWRSEVPLICFDIIEWHFPSRVMRQFGMVQCIPEDVNTNIMLHQQNKQGRHAFDGEVPHKRYIKLWDDRHKTVVKDDAGSDYLPAHGEYMTWYRSITRCIIAPLTD
ncbi:serine/threonine-protein phosphatase 7 long form homolog [Diospyros lotus]|uniref:serine/threonine-protein phosphatase 7 long form homolog n=1 Tax=Diospyros lotus TaxID=55363 RepID=UPI00225B0196|nr:serine/threonine-protein phosphatase 7 long form homolog [Diospyros lotus]